MDVGVLQRLRFPRLQWVRKAMTCTPLRGLAVEPDLPVPRSFPRPLQRRVQCDGLPTAVSCLVGIGRTRSSIFDRVNEQPPADVIQNVALTCDSSALPVTPHGSAVEVLGTTAGSQSLQPSISLARQQATYGRCRIGPHLSEWV